MLQPYPVVHCLVLLFLCTVLSSAQAESDDQNAVDLPSFFSRFFATPASVEGVTELPVAALEVHELRGAPRISKTIDLTAQPDDLWIRLRNGFAMTDLNDDLVLYYQQWYQSRPNALRIMAERSRPFMHHIVEEIEARGMPTELALLPMVESSFNPQAYSRAHAAGLWQFIPSTGKRFKLEQNWWQDQRRDIVASTGAALDYLQTIYDMHGDWHLALASYNWGEGSVKRAIEKNMARGLATDYSSLTMPNETRHYVPKLQALKNIFANPVLMVQLGLPEILNQPYFSRVETDRLVDLKTAARLANMPLQEFKALNPAHNRPVMQEYTPMIIPADRLQTFQNNLENSTAPLSAWQAYTLKPGESINKLAPRFGITAIDLMRINGLHGKMRAVPGATLLVPNGKGHIDLDPMPPPPSQLKINASEPVRAKAGKGKDKGSKGVPAAHTTKSAAVKSSGKTVLTAKAGVSGKVSGQQPPATKGTRKPLAKASAKPLGKIPAKNTKSAEKKRG